jgi:hypothetical protein
MFSHMLLIYQFICMSSYFMLVQDKDNGKCRDCNIRVDTKDEPLPPSLYLVLLADQNV